MSIINYIFNTLDISTHTEMDAWYTHNLLGEGHLCQTSELKVNVEYCIIVCCKIMLQEHIDNFTFKFF